MHDAIKRMLGRYQVLTTEDAENAFREILQETALYALWKGGFFEEAAFYGGSSLRILQGLDRYSEDLDFSLLETNAGFSFDPFRERVVRTMEELGVQVDFAPHEKTRESAVRSAFLKAETLGQLLLFEIPREILAGFPPGKRLKIKLEVDTNPPRGFETALYPVLLPIPFPVRSYREPFAFAGKMHAVLCRKWKTRVKGRDWYDMVWFLGRKTTLDLPHLEQRMRASGDWTGEKPLGAIDFFERYSSAVESLDVRQAIRDVSPFLKSPQDLDAVWSRSFFRSLAGLFRFQPETGEIPSQKGMSA